MGWSIRHASVVGLAGLAACVSILAASCDSDGGATKEPLADDPPADAQADQPSEAEPAMATASLNRELSAAFRLIGQGRTDVARPRLVSYLNQHPDDGRAEFLLGLTYHREKRYALARPRFTQAIELEPQYHPTYHFLGWCLYYLGETQAARVAFEQHLTFVATEGDSHFGIGLIAFDEDRLDDAELRFRTAIKLQADNPRRVRDVSKAHARLADVYIRRNALEDAKAQLQLATDLWPEHYAAFYKLSRVLTRLGEIEAAEEAFRLYKHWQERVRLRRGVPGRAP
ncbi:MAG: tetratricopeptide repeat protein [Planctomycetota bacterium]|nr:tetratricopeptide repeat protein [Planctomycetota bacterium]